MFPGGLFSKTEMSEVLTEILKVDPSFDKDTFLKLCEQDIIPNILEVCGSSLAPVCICCKGLFFATRQWRDICFRRHSVWLFYCCNRASCKSKCLCFSTQAMIQGELEVLKDWCYEAVHPSFHTLMLSLHWWHISYILEPELCVLPSNRQFLITFLLMVFYISSSSSFNFRRTASWLTPFSKPRLWAFSSTPRSWILTILM